jgi:hypothetical protein
MTRTSSWLTIEKVEYPLNHYDRGYSTFLVSDLIGNNKMIASNCR